MSTPASAVPAMGVTAASTASTSQQEVKQQQQLAARPIHLPPIADLESYVCGDPSQSAEHFLNVLPDITEALAAYVHNYPEQVRPVWDQLKPILRDVRRRNRLHGRNVARPPPPLCDKKPSEWTTVHGQVVHDDYAWLKEKENPEVMKYLEAENAYSEASLAHTKTLQKVLFKEFVSRLHESEESARTTLSDGRAYYTRKVPGMEYRLHCRVDKNGFEEVYLDENIMAAELPFFHLGFLRHTANTSHIIAYGVDGTGVERYTVRFMDIDTKQELPDVISDCYEDFEFSNCGRYAFYLAIDQYERAFQLKRHELGKLVEEDVVLYHEEDEMFCLTMTKSCNKRYLLLSAAAQVTSETRFLDLNDPTGTLRMLFPRRNKVNYVVEHHNFVDANAGSQNARGYFYVMTNENAKNNQLFRVPVPSKDELDSRYRAGMLPEHAAAVKESVVDNRDFVLIEAFQLRARHLIVFERSNCMQNIRIVNLTPEGMSDGYHYVSFSEGTVYSIWPGSVDEEVADLSKSVIFDTNILRFTYTSFVQPKQEIDYNMDTKTKTVVYEEQVEGPGFDSELYVAKRLWATGSDGTAVPMSVVYRKDLLSMNHAASGVVAATADGTTTPAVLSGGNPLLLHAYGAYGYCITPIFSTSRLSLLDRGFIFVIAHVRGGSDMGNGWYLEGKLAKKNNTFSDFIACADHLIKEGYTTSEKLAIYGRSAGGLLIGAVVNERPELFKAVLTEVPFVDVINTMFDPTIPWTAFEYEEWGNPDDPAICAAMNAYCPYSNIKEGHLYPHMLIVGGMNDPRVAYFEPAKWTAKLRAKARWSSKADDKGDGIKSTAATTTDADRMLLLRIQDAGHGGNSGQYASFEDLAFEYAFLISALGAQFRPVSSGGRSATGVDYDMYWAELEKEVGAEGNDEDDEDDAAEERAPSTPLQRLSAFFGRRKSGKRPSSADTGTTATPSDSRPSSSHRRSPSSLLSGIKNLGVALRRPSSQQQVIIASPTVTPASAVAVEAPALPVAAKPGTTSALAVTQPSPATSNTSNTSAKGATTHAAIMRHPSINHEQEEASGRVQSSGKLYRFMAKFV